MGRPVIAPSVVSTLPGVIRARPAGQPGVQPAPTEVGSGSGAPLKGPFKVVADDRANVLLLFTSRENMTTAEKIVQVFDVEVKPQP